MITYDGQHLSLKGDVMSLIGVAPVNKIFFIDACQGSLKLWYNPPTAKAAIVVEGNYALNLPPLPVTKPIPLLMREADGCLLWLAICVI